jgi:pyruvate,water dikinase
MGPYQSVEDLADFYDRVTPGASGSEAMTLIQGFGDDLHAVEIASEALAADAALTPAVATALRTGRPATREQLLDLDGGPAFVARLDAFLAEHGHLGQPCDDLGFPSWVEEPAVYLGELAKRIERPAQPAEARRARLRAEAEDLADRTRERLADRPDELATFEGLLAVARDIGPLTEGHNYWIDRMAQSRLRHLSTRVGRRLAAGGSIAAPDDVFYLEHADIEAALVAPVDLRPLVEERRARHVRQQTIRPPRHVGRQPAGTSFNVDRFDGARIASDVPGELRGTGASRGIARGTARVAHTPDDFGRILPGDIIVCPSSNPSWIPVFAIAGGLVTNTGGVLSHAAVVAREFELPAVVGVTNATELVPDGTEIEIDGGSGVVRLL